MAAQMPEKNNKQTIPGQTDPRRSDYITNKVLLVFSGCLLGVFGLMFLNNVLCYSVHWEAGLLAIQVLRIVGVVLAVAGAVVMLVQRKRSASLAYRVFKGSTLLILGLALAVIFSVVAWNPGSGIKLMYVALPAFAFAYLIYHSYQPEFFLIAMDCALAAGAVGLGQTTFGAAYHVPLLILAVVLYVLQIIGVAKVKSDLGRIHLGTWRRYVFDFSGNAYLMMFLTPVLMAVVAAAGLLVGGRVPVACMVAAGAYFFVTAVYYTVKLV